MTDKILTMTIETDVLGVKAYHVRCTCGFETRRFDRQATANKQAKVHADEHAAAMEAAAA